MRLSWLFEWMRASGKKFVAAHLKWPGVSLNDTRLWRALKNASHLSAGMSMRLSMYASYRSDIGTGLPAHLLASERSLKVMTSLRFRGAPPAPGALFTDDSGPSERFFGSDD